MTHPSWHPTTGLYEGATLAGNPTNPLPLIICFHGSGDSCASWLPLADMLSSSYRILLWDRGEHNPKPDVSVGDMLNHLEQSQLVPPYVLIAHSYGGTFAREFLQQRPHAIAGMVMVETGQETALDPKVELQQYKRQILGDKPLSVIRGNTLIWKWKQYEDALAGAQTDAERARLAPQKQLLDATDKEDERLKKEQMKLSSNCHYVHVPDCGHGVIQQRPDIVSEEVRWVMENLQASNSKSTNKTKQILAFFRCEWA